MFINLQINLDIYFWEKSILYTVIFTGTNYVKRSSFELQFKKLPCKSLEGICNVAKSRLNFPQFLLEVLNFLLQVPSFLFCSARCNY